MRYGVGRGVARTFGVAVAALVALVLLSTGIILAVPGAQLPAGNSAETPAPSAAVDRSLDAPGPQLLASQGIRTALGADKEKDKADKVKPPKGDRPPEPELPPVDPPAPPEPPEAPGALAAVACVSGDMVDILTFEPPADGGPVEGIVILRASALEGPFQQVASLGAAERSFSFAVTQTGAAYYVAFASGPGGDGPTSAAVSNEHVSIAAAVPPDGATLRASNGEVRLALAPGTYSATTTVTIEEIAESASGPFISLAGVYDIGPSGPLGAPATLSIACTLRIDHPQIMDVLLRAAGMATLDPITAKWVREANAQLEGEYLVGQLTHFSPHAVETHQPHGTSGAAVNYCTGVCHDLSLPTNAEIRMDARSPQVCFYCHGNYSAADPPAGATGKNVEAEFFEADDQSGPPAGATMHPVGAGFYCSSCHDPHRDPYANAGLLRSYDAITGKAVTGGDAFCWTCHGAARNRRVSNNIMLINPLRDYYVNSGGDHKTGYVLSAHSMVSTPSAITCLGCHTEHGSPAGKLLNARLSGSTSIAEAATDRATGAYAEACLQCHDGSVARAENIKQYVTYDAGYTGAMSYGGHRILSAGGTLPVNAPLPCTNCHGPHGSLRNNRMLLSDALGANFDTSAGDVAVRQFCFACHTTPEGKGWDSATSSYVAVSTSAMVEGLRRDGGAFGSGPDGGYNWLRLKVTPGHAESDADSCYLCHGNSYGSPTSRNVHNPDSYSAVMHTAAPSDATIAIKDRTYGPFACSECHDLELQPEHEKATASTVADGCKACHTSPRDSLTPSWDRTTCAQSNCHAGSSPDPMHGTIDADHTTTGPCSAVGCHSQDAAFIHDIATGGPGCVACHAAGKTATLACGACHPNAHPNSATLNHGSADGCPSCHSTGNLMRVHGDDCTSCHPTPAPIGTVYTGGCSQTGCHPAVTLHSSIPGYYTSHSMDHGDGDDCWSCHGGDCWPCHTTPVERAAPVTTASYKSLYTAAAVVNLSAVDQPTTGSSGVGGTYYQVNGGPIQAGTCIVIMGPAAGSRAYSVEFWSVDRNYNTEAHKVIYFTVSAGTDTLPPTGTMAINNGATYTNSVNVTVNSAVTDPETGVVSMRIDPGTGTFGAWQDYQPAAPTTVSSTNGIKTVRAEYRDAFGHVLALSDTIFLDTVAPTGTMYINNNAVATNSLDVTLNMNISDTGSGVAFMSVQTGSIWSPLEPYATTRQYTLPGTAEGSRTVSVRFYDAAGNMITRNDSIVYDATPPAGTMAINNGMVSTVSRDVQLNSAVTDARSGMSQMRFSNDNVTWSGWVAYAAVYPWTLSAGEGDKTVWAQYSDLAGNVLAVTDTIIYGQSGDTLPPTGAVVINGGAEWTNLLTSTLTLSATDAGGGTVFEMRFSNDNTNWSVWEPVGTTKTWTLTGGAGIKTVYVQYRDDSGNVSTGTISDTIGYETTRPTGTVVINSGAAWTGSQTVTLSLTSSDTGGSGVSHMRFSNDNTNWSVWEPVGTTKTWTLTSGAAIKWVYAQFRDGAGNVSSTVSDTIAYDLSYTLTYSAGTGGTVSGETSQTVNYGDSGTTVTAVPDSGYYFLGWSDGKTAAIRTDTYVTANVNATALFAPDGYYKVQFLGDGSGYVSGQWVQGVAPGGSTTAVTAYPYDSYYFAFSYWSNGSTYLYTPTITINNVTSNQTWTAYFTYTGSCPFLYTWDGERYVFEADEFAAGYLGLRTSRGYRRPNPIDYHVLSTTPAIKDGALEYKLVEERDETDYLDLAQLYTVDAPADRDVYVERSQAEGVGMFTTLDAVIHTTAKNLQPPPSVIHLNTGEDVRDKVAAKDGDRVILNEDRNQSYTYQTLELDLGDVQDAPQVKLVMDGRTMIPTSPEGRAYSRTFGPQVKFEVQDSAGNWVAVPTTKKILPKPPEFDRPFVLDVTNIWVSESRKVRLTYLYKTYFDSILLDTTADVPVTITELPLESAVLQPHGFNFKAGIGEWYDYVYGLPFSPPSYKLPGNYTKFGDVTPLLTEVDDKFVIFGGGDEITLRFRPPVTSAEGLTRSYLFFSNGYYKTLKEDIPHTVEPLPFAAMSNFPYPDTESYPADADHQQYLLEWNTRQEGDL